ncbi:hypothetical protein BH11VER1_BH11VER1_00730 [soil metagenome]
MKNRLFSIATLLVAFVATPKAQAEVGGPFDNGDFNIILEREGVYQATFSFSNGSGMAMFAQDNSFEAATASTVAGQFALHNRSVFYYKGVTYYGTCTGIIDVSAKRVTGFTNGNSDYGAASVSVDAQAGVSGSRASIGSNGQAGFIANSQFNAKITSTAPILRFKGKGEISFMGVPQIDELRAMALAINTGNLNPALYPFNTDTNLDGTLDTFVFTPAISAQIIQNAADLLAQVDSVGTLESHQERQKMKVYGSRRYL